MNQSVFVRCNYLRLVLYTHFEPQQWDTFRSPELTRTLRDDTLYINARATGPGIEPLRRIIEEVAREMGDRII